jgi:DNA-directed RNA polymerase specialized sigma24 family protein
MTLAGDARRQRTGTAMSGSGGGSDVPSTPRIAATSVRALGQEAGDGGSDGFEPISHEYSVLLEDSICAEGDGDGDGDGAWQQSDLAQNLARRAADSRLVEYLRDRRFQGPAQDRLEAALAAYGYSVMMAWTRTGEIFKKVAEKGRPVAILGSGAGWSYDDRAELSAETVAHALVFFRTQILQAGRWDPGRGATIKTYFIGACLHQFPNVYMRWDRERRRWHDNVLMMLDDPDDPVGLREVPGHDDPADTVLGGLQRDQILAELAVRDPVLRRAVLLRHNGFSDAEAAKLLGLTSRALEGRWYRFARDLRRRGEEGRQT